MSYFRDTFFFDLAYKVIEDYIMTDDFRRTDELMDVNYSISQKRLLMNEKFQSKRYGEAINYARSMLEATLKYVYHELTSEEAEIREGHNGYVSLKRLSDSLVDTLAPLISHKEILVNIKDNVTKIICGIGNVRNAGAASHGARIRNIEPQREETLYLLGLAEDTSNFFLKLLYTRTHVEEPNVVGGLFSIDELPSINLNNVQTRKIDGQDGNFNYQINCPLFSVDYWVQNKIVIQVQISLKKPHYDLKNMGESIDEIIDEYLPNEVRGQKRRNGENSYSVYSSRHDKNYDIKLENLDNTVEIYINGIEYM